MMMKTIYFAGTFAGFDLVDLAIKRKVTSDGLILRGFKVIDPLREKPLDKLGKGSDYDKLYKELTPNEIVHRDLWDIDRSDIVLMLMTKPSIGCSCELMYAHLKNKCIVVVSEVPEVLEHPWVKSLSTKVIDSSKEDYLDYIGHFLI